MKKTIITTLAILALTAPLSWGGCDGSSCTDARPTQQEAESLTGTAPEVQQQSKGRSRDASINDFVTPGRAVEKDCANEGCSNNPGQPQPEMRSPEKKGGCTDGGCGD